MHLVKEDAHNRTEFHAGSAGAPAARLIRDVGGIEGTQYFFQVRPSRAIQRASLIVDGRDHQESGNLVMGIG